MTKSSSFADLLRELGGISADRVVRKPAPGNATLRDLVRLQRDAPRILELVDGTIVGKGVGIAEANIASILSSKIDMFAMTNDLGIVVGSKALMRLWRSTARSPEVSFISWGQLPEHLVPSEAYPRLYPDLAVEVFRKDNTHREMARKRRELFRAGCRIFWMVYPKTRTVDVYTSIDDFSTHTEADTLSGGDVLPGFKLAVRSIFVNLAVPKPKPRKRR